MRASEALLMLYDMSTGRIRDMSLIPPGFEGMIEPPPLPAEATANADGTAAVANANDAPLFHLLWPKPGETVTTRDIDFRFDWSMPPDTSPVPGAAALCVVLSKSTNGSEFRAHVTNATAAAAGDLEMDTMVVIRCSENTVSDGLGNVLTLTLTHSGSYHARFFLFHARHADAADPNPSPGTVQAARQARFAQLAVDRALPEPVYEVPALHVALPSSKTAGEDAGPAPAPAPAPAATDDNAWLRRVRVLRPLTPADGPDATWPPVGDVGTTVHVLVISAFSTTRYEEAETMLKSLFMHRTAPVPLVLHMVVDDGGRAYFEALFARPALRRAPRLAVVLHDFDAVCGDPLVPFLEGPLRGMRQSFHHSGKAGYCRLFVAPYFHRLRAAHAAHTGTDPSSWPFTAQDTARLLLPPAVAAVETDQLVLADVAELWGQFATFDADDVVGAPENYQPWFDSRPRLLAEEGTRAAQARERARGRGEEGAAAAAGAGAETGLGGAAADSPDGPGHDGSYHGYGVIGGIMLLHIDRMRVGDWLHAALVPAVLDYQRRVAAPFAADSNSGNSSGNSTSSGSGSGQGAPVWEAQMNDQDLFNAALTVAPQHFRILPCAWNVQFHARLNTVMLCAHRALPQAGEGLGNDTSARDALSVFAPPAAIAAKQAALARRTVTDTDIPLNCPESAARRVFVCEARPKVLHFMAKSYSVDNVLWGYFAGFWKAYARLGWDGIV